MPTPRMILTAFSVASIAGAALVSCASACPLGDCDGSHSSAPGHVGAPSTDRPIYAGVTGQFADDVNFSGTVVQTGRVAVFVEHRFGAFPLIKNGRRINGGIPQEVNMNTHLRKVRKEIDKLIPDRDWDGYAVIDYESWKPEWNSARLKEEYRVASRERVRRANPGLSATEIERRAAQEFNDAAKSFLLETLAEAKRLRPNAKWGFYGFLGDIEADEGAPDEFGWLWDEVDAFYPSVYFRNYGEERWTRGRGTISASDQRDIVRDKVLFAKEMSDGRPILPFVWRMYKPGNPVYAGQPLNEVDFSLCYEYPFDLGIDGLIFWDVVNSRSTQRELEQALRGSLGQRMATALGAEGGGGANVPAEQRRAGD